MQQHSRSQQTHRSPPAGAVALVILRLPSVKARTGLGRSTIYAYVASGDFPRPVPLGPRAVGWIQSEVEEWITRRIEAARKDVTGRSQQ